MFFLITSERFIDTFQERIDESSPIPLNVLVTVSITLGETADVHLSPPLGAIGLERMLVCGPVSGVEAGNDPRVRVGRNFQLDRELHYPARVSGKAGPQVDL